MKIGCYARVSTQDQQTLALQRDAMAAYAQQRGWSMVVTSTEAPRSVVPVRVTVTPPIGVSVPSKMPLLLAST